MKLTDWQEMEIARFDEAKARSGPFKLSGTVLEYSVLGSTISIVLKEDGSNGASTMPFACNGTEISATLESYVKAAVKENTPLILGGQKTDWGYNYLEYVKIMDYEYVR
jgi:hypothetical protein